MLNSSCNGIINQKTLETEGKEIAAILEEQARKIDWHSVAIESQSKPYIKNLQGFNFEYFVWCKRDGSWDKIMQKLQDFVRGHKIARKRYALIDSADVAYIKSNIAAYDRTLLYAEALWKLMQWIEEHYTYHQKLGRKVLTELSEFIAYSRTRATVGAKQLRRKFYQLLIFRCLSNIKYKRRDPYSMIQDPNARSNIMAWMDVACRSIPPARAEELTNYINQEFNTNLSVRTIQAWLPHLGYKYRDTTSIEIYNDGHNRPDVQQYLHKEYIPKAMDARKRSAKYTGVSMEKEVLPNLREGSEIHKQVVISHHDECACHSKELSKYGWKRVKVTGSLKDKDRGELAMVAGYVCPEIGEYAYITMSSLIPKQ